MSKDKQENNLIRRGRYALYNPETGKPATFQRVTNFARLLDDQSGLIDWTARHVAKGMSHPDADNLLLEAGSTDVTNRGAMDRIWQAAKKLAGGSRAAEDGTTIHGLTEAVDRGENPQIPVKWKGHLERYQQLMLDGPLEILPDYIERVVVNTLLGTAGTFDRLCRIKRDTTVTFPSGKTVELKQGDNVIVDVKGLALTEKIPTPNGWTTMGDVEVGDQVFDAFGNVCNVTVKSETKNIGTFIVTFDDGTQVTCDSEHLWWTLRGNESAPKVRGIEEIIDTLRDSQGQATHRVPVTGMLQLPEAQLPFDPYVFGVWLGDGTKTQATITCSKQDLDETAKRIESRGFNVNIRGSSEHTGILSLVRTKTPRCFRGHPRSSGEQCPSCAYLYYRHYNFGEPMPEFVSVAPRRTLRNMGVIGNKHIPNEYLRASAEQRMELLRGLMDSDGTWNSARRTAVFYSQNDTLLRQVEELLLTLGQKPNRHYVESEGFGKKVSSGRIEFTPVGINPFHLERKAVQAAASDKRTTMASRRVITSVEKGPDVPSACISVDSPSRTYLCSERMVPTHNTSRSLQYSQVSFSIQFACYAHSKYLYNIDTERYEELPDINKDVAFIVWIPSTKTEAEIVAVDLEQGWINAQECLRVRERRNFKKLLSTVTSFTEEDPDTFLGRIRRARSREELSAIWSEANGMGMWTKELEAAGKNRLREIT